MSKNPENLNFKPSNCIFDYIKVREISIVNKIKNYFAESKKLALIPDLLLIVFEYSGYENYKIFNFLESRLNLKILKCRMLDLDYQMYQKLSVSIINSIELYQDIKKYQKFKNDEDIYRWANKQAKNIVNEYTIIPLKNKILHVQILQNFYASFDVEDSYLVFNFYFKKVKYCRLSNFWKLIYKVLEICDKLKQNYDII